MFSVWLNKKLNNIFSKKLNQHFEKSCTNIWRKKTSDPTFVQNIFTNIFHEIVDQNFFGKKISFLSSLSHLRHPAVQGRGGTAADRAPEKADAGYQDKDLPYVNSNRDAGRDGR